MAVVFMAQVKELKSSMSASNDKTTMVKFEVIGKPADTFNVFDKLNRLHQPEMLVFVTVMDSVEYDDIQKAKKAGA